MIADKWIFSKERKVQKEIRRKKKKAVNATFLMPHNCSRVGATVTTTFISRMKDHCTFGEQIAHLQSVHN